MTGTSFDVNEVDTGRKLPQYVAALAGKFFSLERNLRNFIDISCLSLYKQLEGLSQLAQSLDGHLHPNQNLLLQIQQLT